MADETPTILPAPIVPAPTASQVWSNALQNITIVAALTAAYFCGKCDISVWLIGLGYVAGVDLVGKKTLSASAHGVAAIGATGALGVLSKLPHVGTVLVAVLTTLTLISCGTVSTLPTKVGAALLKVEDAYVRVDKVYAAVCLPVPVVEKVGPMCVDADVALHSEALAAVNEAVDVYTRANDLLKDSSESDAGAP